MGTGSGAAEAALTCFALAEIQQVRRAKRDRKRLEDRRPRPKLPGPTLREGAERPAQRAPRFLARPADQRGCFEVLRFGIGAVDHPRPVRPATLSDLTQLFGQCMPRCPGGQPNTMRLPLLLTLVSVASGKSTVLVCLSTRM